MAWRLLPAALLLVPALAMAAPPVTNLPNTPFPNKPRPALVSITFNPGDSGESTAIPNVCSYWAGQFGSANGAVASIHGTATAGQSADAGTLLATVNEDNPQVGPIAVSQPFLRLKIVTPPSAGQASFVGMCIQYSPFMRPWPVTDTPPVCIAALAGAVYYDLSLRTLCDCRDDGTPAWEAIDRAIVDTPTAMSCG